MAFMIMICERGICVGQRSDKICRVAVGLQKIPKHQPIAAGIGWNGVTQSDRITEWHDPQDRLSRTPLGDAKQPNQQDQQADDPVHFRFSFKLQKVFDPASNTVLLKARSGENYGVADGFRKAAMDPTRSYGILLNTIGFLLFDRISR
jgi:hypothetical protein